MTVNEARKALDVVVMELFSTAYSWNDNSAVCCIIDTLGLAGQYQEYCKKDWDEKSLRQFLRMTSTILVGINGR